MICRIRVLELKVCSGKVPNLGERDREYSALTIGVVVHIQTFAGCWKRVTRMILRDLDSDSKRLDKAKVMPPLLKT